VRWVEVISDEWVGGNEKYFDFRRTGLGGDGWGSEVVDFVTIGRGWDLSQELRKWRSRERSMRGGFLHL